RVLTWPAIEDRYPTHLYYNHWIRPEAITDESGEFEIRDHSPIYRSVEVSHPHFPKFSKHNELFDASEALEIELTATVHLVGRLKPEGGQSLSEFPRAILFLGRKKVDVEVSSDGKFRTAALPPGSATARLHVDGWIDVDVSPADREGATGEIDLGDVALVRARSLTVTVRDLETRKVVPGARVRLLAPQEESRRERTVDEREAGKDGRVEVSGIEEGDYVVEVTRAGFAKTRREFEINEGEAIDTLEVELPPAATLRGRVVDSRGRGVVGAKLTISPKGPPVEWRVARSSIDGAFRLDGIAAGGAFTLKIEAEHFVDTSRDFTGLDSGKVEEAEAIELSEGLSISGQVVDSFGNGVEGATISYQKQVPTDGRRLGGFRLNPWVDTQVGGQFRIDGITAGKYALQVGYLGRRTHKIVELGDTSATEVEIQFDELGKGNSWSARVFDPEGNPLAGATALLNGARSVSDAKGQLTAFDLAETGSATISHEGFLDREIRWTAVGDLPSEVRLDRGGTIEFRVAVDGTHRSIPTWLRISLSGDGFGHTTSVSLDGLGVGRLEAVKIGECQVQVWHSDFPLPQPQTLELTEGETSTFHLRLNAKTERPYVLVLDSRKRPIENASVSLMSRRGEGRRRSQHLYYGRTGRTGKLSCGLLSSKGVEMTVEAEGYQSRKLDDSRASIDSR
ncbi:MAG: carboxypeptidase-like regulatory domain-containing protein, partial [Planctomycetota bacterium]